MFFTSFAFLLFFAFVFVLFWKLPSQHRWLLLLGASYYFYFSWKPVYVLLLLATTLITYVAAVEMGKRRTKKLHILFLALCLDFGILFLFKYLNFFDYSLSQLLPKLHLAIILPQFSLLLPIGISFYTFQTAGYLIDVYRGKIKAEQHFGVLALFVSFFPQILAGPIGRSTQLLPQFKKKHVFDYERVVSGLQLFALGLFKKLVIADNLGLIVDKIFHQLPEYKGLSLVLAVFFFSWQIYADFSGYTDMARGVARALDFDLLENFRQPYLATSIQDFWRRWHISLSSWFKDYLYIPLGGNRKGLLRTCMNTLIVFVVCGLWHGAAWTFVIWGVFHGVFIAGERIFQYLTHKNTHFPKMFTHVYAYIVVLISWVFFRAEKLSDAIYIFRYALVGSKHFFFPSYIWATLSQMFRTNILEIMLTLFCVGTLAALDILTSHIAVGQLVRRQHVVVRWLVYIVLVMAIILLRNATITQFIYVQF